MPAWIVTGGAGFIGSHTADALLERGCEALARRVADPSYRQNPITRSLNALALLASGKPEYLSLLKREAQWASEFSADSFQTWYYGYVIMLLSEYVMETGDDSVMPGLQRLALEAANGQSVVGSWGHRFTQPNGRLRGYGMMNAPGLPLTVSLILAREAGLEMPARDPRAQKKQDRRAQLAEVMEGGLSVAGLVDGDSKTCKAAAHEAAGRLQPGVDADLARGHTVHAGRGRRHG